jgi:hypothetical protein
MHKVENMCKTMLKTMCNLCENFCGILNLKNPSVEKRLFTQTFPTISTKFSTRNYSLFLRNLFHFSTKLTITTINIIK